MRDTARPGRTYCGLPFSSAIWTAGAGVSRLGGPMQPCFASVRSTAPAHPGHGGRRALSAQRFTEYITHGEKGHGNRQTWQHPASSLFQKGRMKTSKNLAAAPGTKFALASRYSRSSSKIDSAATTGETAFRTAWGRRGGPGTKTWQRIEDPVFRSSDVLDCFLSLCFYPCSPKSSLPHSRQRLALA